MDAAFAQHLDRVRAHRAELGDSMAALDAALAVEEDDAAVSRRRSSTPRRSSGEPMTGAPRDDGRDPGARTATRNGLRLLVVSDDRSVTHALPDRGRLTVGSGADCDVRLEDPAVAPRHALLIVGDGIELLELGSGAGTWVREAPLYFAQWDERYRPAVVAGAVGASAAPLLASMHDGFDVRGELNLVTAPTLIVSARDDGWGTYAGAIYTAQHIAGARLLALADGGHLWIGHHREVMGEIAAFLTGSAR